jgi:hypothetical protein
MHFQINLLWNLMFFVLLSACAGPAQFFKREPSSIFIESFSPQNSRAELIKDLKRLYPHLGHNEIVGKIDNSTDAFMMYRGLVPYYFDLAMNDRSYQNNFASLLKQRAWLMGDVHPENFGFLLNRKGKAIFQMNDPDDSGVGPLFTETFRYFVGVELALRRMNIKQNLEIYKQAYLAGLSSQSMPTPRSLASYLDRSEKRGMVARERFYDKDKGLLYDLDNRTRIASGKLRRDLKSWVEREFPEAEFKDASNVDRDFGGSAFLKRYWVLVRFSREFTNQESLGSRWQILELKEIAPSGVELLRLSSEKVFSPTERIDKTLNILFGAEQPLLYRTTHLNGDPFYVRPRWHGVSGLSPSDLEATAVSDLLQWQAWTLGRLQKNSLNHSEQQIWLREWHNLNERAWQQQITKYSNYFEKLYKSTVHSQ